MIKRTKVLSSSLALSVVLALTGCGGSDDSSTATAVATGTGYYLDSAVSGVHYLCGSITGTTNSEGAFTFQAGKECTFKVDEIVIKSIPSAELTNQVKIVEDNVTVARFLQTLDADGDATNGIEITPEITQALHDGNISKLPTDDTELDEVYLHVKNEVTDYNGTVVTVEDAESHLSDTKTNVTKSLFSNQTFYVMWSENNDTEHALGKAVFNYSVTEVIYDGLINDTDHDEDTVRVEEDKIVWSDNSYSKITSMTPAYILLTEYNADGSVSGETYAYYSQTAAEAAYNAKYVAPVTTSSTNVNFDAYNSIEIMHDIASKYTTGGSYAPGFAGTIVSSDINCKVLGFTEVVDHFEEAGFSSDLYRDVETNRVCIDEYFGQTVDSGSTTFVVYGNVTK